MNAPPLPLLERFSAIVGPANAIRDPEALRPFLTEPRDLFRGRAAIVLKPGSVAEVAEILALASETRTPIVPQGGNTGLVGGQIPSDAGNEIIVSLSRLNKLRRIDATNNIIIAEAGAILADVQAAASGVDRLFPLTLASEGSCEIGGNLSTNAGGTGVLAYGNTRELVLGVEVVLASGAVWNGLRILRKDNTGYDLKDLFIGAEGTLGIITAAVLKLAPKPRGSAVAFIGIGSARAGIDLLHVAQGLAGRSLTAFELIPRFGMETVLKNLPGARDPLAGQHDWYVLAEVSSASSEADAIATIEGIFADGMEKGLVEDGALAQSLEQADAFWRIRHALSEVQKFEGGSIKHDVAVPIASIPELIERASVAVDRLVPGVRPLPFGHIGDGNLHLNFSQPVGMDKQAFLARWSAVNELVHVIVTELEGTISAEHGIGRLKRDLLPRVKSPVEMEMMRTLKKAFDPLGILNPGKVL